MSEINEALDELYLGDYDSFNTMSPSEETPREENKNPGFNEDLDQDPEAYLLKLFKHSIITRSTEQGEEVQL